jgi:hypothetical protein
MHHTGSWTKQMCILLHITDPYEHQPGEVQNGFKILFFRSRTATSTYSISIYCHCKQFTVSIYMPWCALQMVMRMEVPLPKVAKKNCANPHELFSGCVTHHSALWNFALWTIGVTHHTPWTCGWNNTVY